MQGCWVGADEPSSELVVNGGEITCFGRVVDYGYKEIAEIDGALTVNLLVGDEADEDAFQRANITGLVITPEGEFHAWNVKFAARFVRAPSWSDGGPF
jgi:hypothetical protein